MQPNHKFIREHDCSISDGCKYVIRANSIQDGKFVVVTRGMLWNAQEKLQRSAGSFVSLDQGVNER